MEAAEDKPDRQTELKQTSDGIVLENTLASGDAGCDTVKPEALERRHSDDQRHGDDLQSDVFSDTFTTDSSIPQKSEASNPRDLLRRPSGSSLSTSGRHRPSVTFAADVADGGINSRKSSSHSSLPRNAKEAGSLSPEYSSLDRSRTLSLVSDIRLLPSESEDVDKQSLRVDIIFATVLVVLYILSETFNVLAAVCYHDDHYEWFLVLLLLTVIPSLITQIVSYTLGAKDEHSNDDTITILHLLQLGVISRYSRLLWKGIKLSQKTVTSQAELLSVICLFHCFVSVAPQLVIQLFLMADHHDASPTLILSVCVQMITFAYCLAFHRLDLRSEIALKLARLLTLFLWRFLIISSRVVAMGMFIVQYGVWILFVFAIQIILFVTAHVIYIKKNGGVISVCDFLQTILLSYTYLFCFLNHIEGQTRYRYLVYYSYTFLSNTLLILVWYVDNDTFWYGHFALAIVWGCFLLGLIPWLIYYYCLHHKRWDSRDIGMVPSLSSRPSIDPMISQTKSLSEEEQSRKETVL